MMATRPTTPADSSARLSVRDLSVERSGRQVLRGLSFDLRPGEVVGLLGRNGAGKTTLFQVLCGCSPPTQGNSLWTGNPSLRATANSARAAAWSSRNLRSTRD